MSKPSLCQLAVFENATEYRRTSMEKKSKTKAVELMWDL